MSLAASATPGLFPVAERCYVPGVATTIPQRDLRNDVSAVLRRVEAGEEFIVTVSGRPVAELRPIRGARGAFAAFVAAMAERPPLTPEQRAGLEALDAEIEQMNRYGEDDDPWQPT